MAIIKKKKKRRKVLIRELQTEKLQQEIELTKKIDEMKKHKKNTAGFSNVEDSEINCLKESGKIIPMLLMSVAMNKVKCQ